MKQSISPRTRAIAYLFFLIYFASYTMRINFAVMIVSICEEMSVEKTSLALVLTALTIAYGIGQVLSGKLGEYFSPNIVLSSGLFLAIASNLAMFFCRSIPSMTVIWAVNGLSHACLWPPIITLMSSGLDGAEYNYTAVRVSWGSSVATIMLYSVCPLLLKVMSWRQVLLLCAGVGAAVLASWLIFAPRLFGDALHRTRNAVAARAESHPIPRYAIAPILLIMVGIVLHGMLRDGVTNWMPSFLLESFGLSESNAIFAAVVPAIFSMFCFSAFNLLHRRLFRNEVSCAAVIYVLSTAACAVLYFSTRFGGSVVLSMLMMAVVIGCTHGVNLMFISIAPKRFAAFGTVSTFSGLLNACTYLGAAISNYGVAALADGFGWGVTTLSWGITAALGILVSLAAAGAWSRFKRDGDAIVAARKGKE